MIRPRPRLLTLVCSSALLLASHAAWAKPKVALTAIEGDASGDVHDAVAEALEGKEVSLIGSKEVNRAVDKIGDVADLTEKDLKKLSTQLEADAIVIGKLDKSGGAKSLKFRIYAHKKMAKGFTVNFKDAKSEKFHTLLHDKILDKIGVAAGGEEDAEKPADKPEKLGKKGKKAKGDDEATKGGDDEDPLAATGKKGKKAKKAKGDDEVAKGDDEETKPRKAKGGDDEEAKPRKAKGGDDEEAKPRKAKGGDDEETKPKKAEGDEDAKPKDGDDDVKPRKKVASSEEGGGEEVEGGVAASASPARGAVSSATPGVRVDVGLSVLQRSYKFTTNNTMVGPKDTSLSPVPGARLDGEIYPFALSGSGGGPLAGLGLGGELDRTLTLNLKSSANGMTATTSVKQMNYSIGARYRIAFGKGETPTTLTLGLGYGKRLFSPDKSKIMDPVLKAAITRDTPTTEYTLIDPGATLRLPVTRMIALSVGARGMVITNGGPIQAASSYGAAKVYGVEASAGVDVLLGSRFVLEFSGNFDQIGYTFQNKGTLSKDGDGNPIVGGLADRAIGGAATLGVMY